MKKLLTILALACAATLTVNAQDGEGKPKKPELTEEQKAVKKELTEKYDTNKDGKLDKEERSKMSPEDKAKWEAAFPHKQKDAPKKEETN